VRSAGRSSPADEDGLAGPSAWRGFPFEGRLEEVDPPCCGSAPMRWTAREIIGSTAWGAPAGGSHRHLRAAVEWARHRHHPGTSVTSQDDPMALSRDVLPHCGLTAGAHEPLEGQSAALHAQPVRGRVHANRPRRAQREIARASRETPNVAVVMYPIPIPRSTAPSTSASRVRTRRDRGPADRFASASLTRLTARSDIRVAPPAAVRVASDSVRRAASSTLPSSSHLPARGFLAWAKPARRARQRRTTPSTCITSYARASCALRRVVRWGGVRSPGLRGRRARKCLGSRGRMRRATSPMVRHRRGPVRATSSWSSSRAGLTGGTRAPAGAKRRSV
jgi:hypothetical protein